MSFRNQKGSDVTDTTDPLVGEYGGTVKPDVAPSTPAQRVPRAVDAQDGLGTGFVGIAAGPDKTTGHRAGLGSGAGAEMMDAAPAAEPGHAEFPDWPDEVQKISLAGKCLIWLSGASRPVLAECPTELPKYTGLGLTVLIPGLMAAVSMAFALVTTLRADLWAALLVAVTWAAIIVSLDRTFVVSMPRKGTGQAQLFRAIPRFALSLILGSVISTPFVLQIFRPEIVNQLQQMRAAQRAEYFKALPQNPLYLTVQKDQATVSQLTEQAATGGQGINPTTDPTIVAWQKQLANARNNEVISTSFTGCTYARIG